MVEVQVVYQGQLHCEATHGPSGNRIQTDAPKDNMGKGEAFSPTDLVGTSLGTCILTILGIIAQKHGLDIAGSTATVKKEMSSSPPRRISRLSVDVHIPPGFPEEHRELLEDAAHGCPVHRSLHPDVDAPITFHWG
jgi:putative redox protein